MKKLIKIVTVLSLGLGLQSVAKAAEVDLTASNLKWSAEKKIAKGHHGTIPISSATAEFDGEKFKKAEIIVNMTAFTVDDLEGEYQKKFLGHVRSGDFFEADKYKTAKLELTSMEGNKAKGNLTIKEKTNPVEIEFKKDKKAYKGTFVFDRTKYGITYGSGTVFSALGVDKIIKDDVKVEFNIVLK